MSFNPDYLDGMRAFDAGQHFDPKQRGQWRRGWERARDNWAANNPGRTRCSLCRKAKCQRCAACPNLGADQ